MKKNFKMSGLFMALLLSFIGFHSNAQETFPVDLEVFPTDRTVIFQQNDLTFTDGKAFYNNSPITGFVVVKDNPVPIKYENGQKKEYAAGNKWYNWDDVDLSDDMMTAFDKRAKTPLTGFIVKKTERNKAILEFKNGKNEGNRFIISGSGKWPMAWTYFKDGHISHFQEFYENGFLMFDSKYTDKELIKHSYYPNGQLMFQSHAPYKNKEEDVENLQELFYGPNGHLIVYINIPQKQVLCIKPDWSKRPLEPAEIQSYFNEMEQFPYSETGAKIPEFHCK